MKQNLLLWSFVALSASACQAPVAAGTVCTSASSCGAPLVCRFGRCRAACVANRDCPPGAQCFLDASGLGACQLDVDRSCGSDACGDGLTCLDTECVRECRGPDDCPSDGACSIASGGAVGVCTDLRRDDGGTGPVDGAVDGGVPPVDGGGPPVDAGGSCTPLVADHVCVGTAFACAIDADGSVMCWGNADANILGSSPPTTTCAATLGGTTPCRTLPQQVPLYEGGPLLGAVAIGCGQDFACAIVAEGHVRCWGRNYAGMVSVDGDGFVGAREVADTHGDPLVGAGQLAVGVGYACVVTPSDVRCWGVNTAAQLGRGTTSASERAAIATELAPVDGVRTVITMSDTTCIVSAGPSPSFECLGDNAHGQLSTDPHGTPFSSVARPFFLALGSRRVVSGGDDMACALDGSDHVVCWGWNVQRALGRATASEYDLFPGPLEGSARAVPFGSLFTGATRLSNCAADARDTYCWGANGSGQAAQEPRTEVVLAARVEGLPPVVEGSCGQQGCCAVDGARHVWCWGANDVGQLGRGTTSVSEWVPGQVCAQ